MPTGKRFSEFMIRMLEARSIVKTGPLKLSDWDRWEFEVSHDMEV